MSTESRHRPYPTVDPGPETPVITHRRRKAVSGRFVKRRSIQFITDPSTRGCDQLSLPIFIEGECLKPSGVHHGYWALIGEGIQPRNGEIAMVRVLKDAATSATLGTRWMLKHYYHRGDRVLLWTSNHDFRSLLFPADAVSVFGCLVSAHESVKCALELERRLYRLMARSTVVSKAPASCQLDADRLREGGAR